MRVAFPCMVHSSLRGALCSVCCLVTRRRCQQQAVCLLMVAIAISGGYEDMASHSTMTANEMHVCLCCRESLHTGLQCAMGPRCTLRTIGPQSFFLAAIQYIPRGILPGN